MALINVNITVTVDAEDLIEEVGLEKATRLIQKELARECVEALSDELSQLLVEVDVNGTLVPVAVRDVKVQGLEGADDEQDDEEVEDDCEE